MTIEDDIRDTFKADAESVIDDNNGRLEGLFKYHDDGTINLSSELSDANGRIQMLTYLIAQHFIFEAGDADSPELNYEFFYRLFDVKDNTVRKWAQQLRDDGLIETKNGEHSLVPENLPEAIDMIEGEIE